MNSMSSQRRYCGHANVPCAHRSTRSLRTLVTLVICGAIGLLALEPQLAAAPAPPPPEIPELNTATRAAIIDSVTTPLLEIYIFADQAEQMDRLLRTRLKDGDYDDISSPEVFTEQLTEDLRSICQDRHLRVGARPPAPSAEAEVSDEDRRAAYRKRLQRSNFAFEKVEILPGNVGYLKFNQFVSADLGGATAVAAMNFLAYVDALIIDLRNNGGGSPTMIQLLTSYLLDEPTHLNSFYIRHTDETQQFWTQAHVAGPRLSDVPVWVLTSQRTFSGAEEFSYNLRNLERATLVGETTGGGAHPVQGHEFDFGSFVVTMSLPYGRAINPISGTNWEGTGVEPHIAVPAAEALITAKLDAYKTLEKDETDEAIRQQIAWARRGLEVQLEPVTIAPEVFAQYVGVYGPRRIFVEADDLYYQREERPRLRLIPMGNDMFMLEDLDYFRVQFARNKDGDVVRIVGLYDSGHQDGHDRTGN